MEKKANNKRPKQAVGKKDGDTPDSHDKKPDIKIDDVLNWVKSHYEETEVDWSKLPKHMKEFIKPRKSQEGVMKENILHEMARRVNDFDDARYSFTAWLVSRSQYSSLLKASIEDYHNTPFHRALQVSNDRFVTVVIENSPQKRLLEILKPKDSKLNERNCLHVAIEKGCQFTETIIGRCRTDAPDVFQQGDNEATKNTPLHLEVMRLVAQDSPEAATQKTIVESLIAANPEVLLQQNAEGDVPYQARIRKLSKDESHENHESREDILVSADHELLFPDADEDTEEHSSHSGSARSGSLSRRLGGEIGAKDDETRVEEGEEGEIGSEDSDGSEFDPTRSNDAETGDDSEEDEEVSSNASNGSEFEPATSEEEFEDDEHLTREENIAFRRRVIDDPILKIIRSYSIRHFERSKVTTALYHETQERETYFNLSGRSNLSITNAYLEKLARHLKFESILSYVALPMLSVLDLETVDPLGAFHNKKSMSKGRRDMGAIFEWLRLQNVETIHAITVIDSTEPSHSDTAIENALRGFDIEVWDWKKLDLNCDVISNCAGETVREISLYSSGNYAVLMGWASTDGLGCRKRFPKLKHVHLYYQDGLENETTLERYIDGFKTKLRQNRNDDGDSVEVISTKDDKSNSYMDGFRVRGGGQPPSQGGNRWLDSMTKFLQIIFNIPPKVAGYVKISVIDNGVDASLDALDGKIAVGTSFCPIPDTTYHKPYYMTSEAISHGSMVAGLICRMCPKAKLYVARIDELPSSGRQNLLTAESAAKAIQWAVKKKVDVICMSWTIERNIGQNDAGIEQLTAAIDEAERAKIIMLCAASDQGSDSKASLPGSTQKCIRIGASTEHGDKCSWLHNDDYDYCFPGENVPFKTGREGLVKLCNGSSAATAIAAGSVGLLLYLNNLVAKERGIVSDMKRSNDMKSREAIIKCLDSLCRSSKSSNSKCPRFGNTFGNDFNEFMIIFERDVFFQKLGQIMDDLKKLR
ncbi:hypothetical protein F4803DRAFT_551238 [Xylaria telfairii]|nr:hypothetical protein F4803DRAFT_551238 [Xylaria telfairii]